MKRLSIFVMTLCLFFAGTAYSALTINVPGNFDTIQKAIDAASEGDIIEVAAGTYVENLSIVNKDIISQ